MPSIDLQLSVLIVEDEEHKVRPISAFLRELGLENIFTAGSLSSAIAALDDHEIDLAIVDMSIPTYDFAEDWAGGGRPLGFGGADILRFIDSEMPHARSVVLTQYEELPSSNGVSQDLATKENELRSELGTHFLGLIHYDGQHGKWRETLVDKLTGAFGKQ